MAVGGRRRLTLGMVVAAPLLLAVAGGGRASASATIPVKGAASDGPACGGSASPNVHCWVPSSLSFDGEGSVQWQSPATVHHHVPAGGGSWGGQGDPNPPFPRG